MQASSALEIINALIDGAHPFSGESLSQVGARTRVLRALFTAVRALEKSDPSCPDRYATKLIETLLRGR